MPAVQQRPSADFRLYFAGRFISDIGSAFTTFAIPLLIFTRTGSSVGLGLSLAVSLLPYLLFGFVAGAVVDRVDRRSMMIGIDLARAALLVSLPLIALGDDLNLFWIYAVAFLGSTLQIPFTAGQFASVTHLVGKDHLVTANGRLQAATSLAQIAGPVLAGIAVATMPVVDLLLIDAATFALSAAALALIRVSFNDVRPPGEGPRRVAVLLRALRADIREGLTYVWRNPLLRSIAVTMAVVNLFASTTLAQLVFYAKRQLSAGNGQVSLLFAAGAAGVMLVSLAAGRLRRIRLGVLLVASLALNGITVVGLGLTSTYAIAIVLWAVNSAVSVLFNISTMTLRQQIVPDRLLGRVMTVSMVLAWSVIPIGALAGGFAVAQARIGPVMIGIGVVIVLTAAVAAGSPLGRARLASDERAAPPQTAPGNANETVSGRRTARE
ncbi:MFS transporter [Actinoplanes sp. NPDC026623]|uniref:MFS transporter n=1 Tax=Actinoplanes sp. NPDC026623 TaxID=3155610 RepID=UPI0033DA8A5D